MSDIAPPTTLIGRLPQTPGVYRFRDRRGAVLYIGRATNLRSRVRSYWGDLGDRQHLATMVRRIADIEAVSCASLHEACWLERNLIAARKPPWNRGIGGAEVEVLIRWDAGSLNVTHTRDATDGCRYFGPYLGGVRTRRAVTGLHRLFPVRYAAADRGTARGMAEALGIDRADGPAMVRAMTRVLERRPAAVAAARATMIGRRHLLAEAMQYEAAGTVQTELDAIEWIVADQQVCLLEPEEHQICGWVAGRLVRFAMRDGRIVDWTIEACDERTATPAMTASPPRWAAFARRNAELAASLADG